MKQGSKNIKQSILNRTLCKAVIHYFFLVVVACTFFLQQVQAFTFLGTSVNYDKAASNLSKINYSNVTNFSLLYTEEVTLSSLEMEEVEDDEKQNCTHEFYSNYTHQYAADALAYNGILKIRYLHLASSIHQQAEVPYFILYHSWKNHLA